MCLGVLAILPPMESQEAPQWSSHGGDCPRLPTTRARASPAPKGQNVLSRLGPKRTPSAGLLRLGGPVGTPQPRRYKQAAGAVRLPVGISGGLHSGSQHVDGTMLHPERFTRGFSDAVRRLGLPPIRLHDLRHGWATLALQAGVHPKIVQERLGHANIGITLDTYSHVVGGLHEDAAEQVAALFRGSAGGDARGN